MTVMDEPKVAIAVTPPGGGGAGWGEVRRKNQLGWTEIGSYHVLLFNCRHDLENCFNSMVRYVCMYLYIRM